MTVSPDASAGRARAFSTLGCPGAELDVVIDTALAHGCRGLELRVDDDTFLPEGISDERLAFVRARLDEAGLTVLTATTRLALAAPAGAGRGSVVDLVRALGVARTIGAGGVRVFMGDPHETRRRAAEPTPGELRAADLVASVAGRFRDAGVRLYIESHDSHSTGLRLGAFLDMLTERGLGDVCGVVWDVAHSWHRGEPPTDTLPRLADHLAFIQLKDVASASDPRPVLPGLGAYPIAELATALDRAAWNGWVSLEWERRWHPELPSIDQALEAAAMWSAALDAGADAA